MSQIYAVNFDSAKAYQAFTQLQKDYMLKKNFKKVKFYLSRGPLATHAICLLIWNK